MNANKMLVLLGLIMLALFSCGDKNKQPVPNANTMPAPFRFVLLGPDGSPLITSENQSVNLYFFQNGNKVPITSYQIRRFNGDAASPYPFYYSSLDAPIASADSGIKDFYLEVNGEVLPVYLEVMKLKEVDPVSKGLYVYRKVMFNGKEVPEYQNTMPWVYVFRK